MYGSWETRKQTLKLQEKKITNNFFRHGHSRIVGYVYVYTYLYDTHTHTHTHTHCIYICMHMQTYFSVVDILYVCIMSVHYDTYTHVIYVCIFAYLANA